MTTDIDDGSVWAAELRRGLEAQRQTLKVAGGGLSAEDVAQRLQLSSTAEVDQLAGRALLAVDGLCGGRVFPARQFRDSDGAVRFGLPSILRATTHVNPWVLLSILTGPDPITGQGVALDYLDDPDVTAAVIELMRSYGIQGAS